VINTYIIIFINVLILLLFLFLFLFLFRRLEVVYVIIINIIFIEYLKSFYQWFNSVIFINLSYGRLSLHLLMHNFDIQCEILLFFSYVWSVSTRYLFLISTIFKYIRIPKLRRIIILIRLTSSSTPTIFLFF